jgi:hypothetical protein
LKISKRNVNRRTTDITMSKRFVIAVLFNRYSDGVFWFVIVVLFNRYSDGVFWFVIAVLFIYNTCALSKHK